MSDERTLSTDGIAEGYPDYEGQVVDSVTRPAREGETVDPRTVLPETLADSLPIDGLYEHQAGGIESLAEGDDIVVSTSTASGKTYIYALYFALCLRENPNATGIFTYPTKALAGDQQQELNDLYDQLGLDILVEKYDGDTPGNRRRRIRERADIVVTNFAAINVYLHDHTRWRRLFRNCELLVVDEAHAYTGIQGMHVAWICRRLQRVLTHYGSSPQVVCSSATIGNPVEHARQLTGRETTLVGNDTSPQGARDIAFWQPPVSGGSHGGNNSGQILPDERRSANSEAASLLAHLGLNDVQTLLFARSRQGVEVTAKQAEQAASRHPSSGYLDVQPYHAGHGKETRRGTEHRLKTGALDGVVSTTALELGIDIGSVDAAVLAGYPGSRQSFWQQLGRAGRGTDRALGVLVARANAIDQYVLDNPDYLLGDDVEDAVVDLTNNAVYATHLLCAADEVPLTADDTRWFGDSDRLERGVRMWKDAGELVGSLDRGVQYNGKPRPQAGLDMYGSGGDQFEVRCPDADIDITDIHRSRAYREYHPGALVLHDGKQYEVEELVEDTRNPHVTLSPVDTNEYTRTQHTKEVRDLDVREQRDLGGGFTVGFGMGTVNIHYDSFTRHEIASGEMVGMPQPLDLPPVDLRTQLMWVTTPPEFQETVVDTVPAETLLDGEQSLGDREYTFLGGLHGAEHAMIKLAPLELNMSKSDMGGLSLPRHPETGGPTWFIHDAVDGGIGFARAIYDDVEAVAARTRERVDSCECEDVRGCPSCLMDDQCGNRNEPLHTAATTEILGRVLERF